MSVKILHDKETAVTWAVRLVHRGERFGLNDALVHDRDDPLVEFYDVRHAHTDLGQFVQRYFRSTLLEAAPSSRERGLALDMGVSAWTVSASCMEQLSNWLATDHRPTNEEPVADGYSESRTPESRSRTGPRPG